MCSSLPKVGRGDEVADVRAPEASHAGNRREHPRVAEVELRVGESRPRGSDDRCIYETTMK